MLGSHAGWLGKLREAPSLFPPRSSWTKRMLGFTVLRLTGPTLGFAEVVTEVQRGDKACLDPSGRRHVTWLLCSLSRHLSWAVQTGVVTEGYGQSSKPWVNLNMGEPLSQRLKMATQCPPEKCSEGISSRCLGFIIRGLGFPGFLQTRKRKLAQGQESLKSDTRVRLPTGTEVSGGGGVFSAALLCFHLGPCQPPAPIFNTAIRELLDKDSSDHVSWFPPMITVMEEHLPAAGRPGLAPDDGTSLTSYCSLKLPGPSHQLLLCSLEILTRLDPL